MCKADIFNEIIQIVSRETEIAPKVILSGSKGSGGRRCALLACVFLFKEGLLPLPRLHHWSARRNGR